MTKTRARPPKSNSPSGRTTAKKAIGAASLNIWRPQAGTNQYNCCTVTGGVLDGANGNVKNFDPGNPLQQVWGLVVRSGTMPTLTQVQSAGKQGTVMGGYMWQIIAIPAAQSGSDNVLVVYGSFQLTGPMTVPVTVSFYGCP